LVTLILLKSREVEVFLNLIKKVLSQRVEGKIPTKETETISPPTSDTQI